MEHWPTIEYLPDGKQQKKDSKTGNVTSIFPDGSVEIVQTREKRGIKFGGEPVEAWLVIRRDKGKKQEREFLLFKDPFDEDAFTFLPLNQGEYSPSWTVQRNYGENRKQNYFRGGQVVEETIYYESPDYSFKSGGEASVHFPLKRKFSQFPDETEYFMVPVDFQYPNKFNERSWIRIDKEVFMCKKSPSGVVAALGAAYLKENLPESVILDMPPEGTPSKGK